MGRATRTAGRGYEVPAGRLRRTVNPAWFAGRTSDDLVPREAGAVRAGGRREAAQEMMAGQRRAMEAIDFGIRMRGRGFNLFVLGEPGSGKTTSVERIVEAQAAREPPAEDVCYVHDFDRPEAPRGIPLPPGRAHEFARDVESVIADLAREVPKALAAPAFRDERNRLLDEGQRRTEQRLTRLVKQARRLGVHVRREGDRLGVSPLRGAAPITAEEYEGLSDAERVEHENRLQAFQRRMPEFDRDVRRIQKGLENGVLSAERRAIASVVDGLFADLRRDHGDLGEPIRRYLDQLQAYVFEHHRVFLPPEERAAAAPSPGPGPGPGEPPPPSEPAVQERAEFQVRVLVDRRRETCAPVVVERNPTYPNLFGYLEYREDQGIYATDHTMLRAGALHRANGGYLILQLTDLLRSPYAWDALKRALRHQEIRIEDLDEEAKPKTTGTVRPTPMPLRVKVVLVGTAEAYYALHSQDEDFPRLFKVKADFEPAMPFNRRTLGAVARFVARAVREEGLLPLDRGALARVLEHGVREVSDQTRISTRLATLIDLVSEAHHWAERGRRRVITAADVSRALLERTQRHAKDEDGILHEIRDRTILIETRGAVVGQVNGLTVYDQGDHSFGVPVRITARTYVGRKGLVNIDREVRLSGALHDKGALILVGFLGGRFARRHPLIFSASVTFEQNYGLIEGDSASAAELFAVLSSLAGVPLRQGIAVTGSVNQQGQIQPVGGVNEKIEGFFKTCRLRGLTGEEGVIIPRLNLRHLMLSREVVEAVRARRFRIWAIDHVDPGIEILAGLPAGARTRRGTWEEGTINDLVDRRLAELTGLAGVDREGGV